jgi:peptide/nickel transport system permease protein
VAVLAYVVRRVLISIPVLIGSSILVFIIVKLSGNPLSYLIEQNPPPSRHVIALERHRLRLDESWPEQYGKWIWGLLHGSFGPPVHEGDHVGAELGSALWVTMRLIIAAIVIALILAVITGVVSAVKQYSVVDYTSTFLGFLFLSMPVFWFAVLLKSAGIWYNENVQPGAFYTIGEKSVVLTDNSTWAHVRDIAGHMILPTIVLALASYAAWTRFTRASMLEVLGSDHIRLARAKGLRSRRVLIRHALRNALIPLTTVTALDIATLLGGAVITETVFQWHGMGTLLLNAIDEHDAYLMLGWMMIAATIVIVFNLIADLLYGVLDPRIRHA